MEIHGNCNFLLLTVTVSKSFSFLTPLSKTNEVSSCNSRAREFQVNSLFWVDFLPKWSLLRSTQIWWELKNHLVVGGLLSQNLPEFYEKMQYWVDFVITIEWIFSFTVLMPGILCPSQYDNPVRCPRGDGDNPRDSNKHQDQVSDIPARGKNLASESLG